MSPNSVFWMMAPVVACAGVCIGFVIRKDRLSPWYGLLYSVFACYLVVSAESLSKSYVPAMEFRLLVGFVSAFAATYSFRARLRTDDFLNRSVLLVFSTLLSVACAWMSFVSVVNLLNRH